MKEILKKDIGFLNFEKNIYNKLLNNEVKYVYELCALNRKKLKEIEFNASEINSIIVKLQLQGLDLGKNYKVK